MARLRHRRTRGQHKAVLTNGVTAVMGEIACIDTSTGLLTVVSDSTTLIPIGYFNEDLVGDGETEIYVDLFREVFLDGFANDEGGGEIVFPDDSGTEVYLKDGGTVTKDSANSTRSLAGRALFADEDGVVYVEAGLAVTGPTGPGIGSTAYAMLTQDKSLPVPLLSFCETDGTPLAAFSDGASATPGLELTELKALGVRWNNHATPDPIATQVMLPRDLDASKDLTIRVLASKVGATVGDAVTFDVEVFFQEVGALHDADADAGGTTDAMTGDAATKTVQEVTLTVAADDVPDAPCVATITVQPTDGTLGTDDVVIHGIELVYTPTAAA